MTVQKERRRSARKDVLETFHMFLVIPERGLRKIHLKDVSEGGLGFYGEPADEFRAGSVVRCYFYLNPSLRLPLTLKITHVTEGSETRRVGCELQETTGRAYQAYVAFLHLLDDLAAFVD